VRNLATGFAWVWFGFVAACGRDKSGGEAGTGGSRPATAAAGGTSGGQRSAGAGAGAASGAGFGAGGFLGAGGSGAGGFAGAAGMAPSNGSSGRAGSGAVNPGGHGGAQESSGGRNDGGKAGDAVAGTPGSTAGSVGATSGSGGAGSGEGGDGEGGDGEGGDGEGGDGGEAGATSRAGTSGHGASGTAGASGALNEPKGLAWPIDCLPGETCAGIGYPDIDGDGRAYDCGEPGYVGHEGTDIRITGEQQAAGTAVRAAADGTVLFAFDGKYDQCPNSDEPDCQDPPSTAPGSTTGDTVCTPIGPYCGTGEPGCYWCFAGGNVIVIRHQGVPGVFATRYDHLKKNSVRVHPGDRVSSGQQIAEAGSAGNSTGPHLHFEVWGTGFYELADPWTGPCGPNTGPSLWAHDPPW
jgi:murein DD-endopeptidase MepM/ murein hydrolase activator NlpD